MTELVLVPEPHFSSMDYLCWSGNETKHEHLGNCVYVITYRIWSSWLTTIGNWGEKNLIYNQIYNQIYNHNTTLHV